MLCSRFNGQAQSKPSRSSSDTGGGSIPCACASCRCCSGSHQTKAKRGSIKPCLKAILEKWSLHRRRQRQTEGIGSSARRKGEGGGGSPCFGFRVRLFLLRRQCEGSRHGARLWSSARPAWWATVSKGLWEWPHGRVRVPWRGDVDTGIMKANTSLTHRVSQTLSGQPLEKQKEKEHACVRACVTCKQGKWRAPSSFPCNLFFTWPGQSPTASARRRSAVPGRERGPSGQSEFMPLRGEGGPFPTRVFGRWPQGSVTNYCSVNVTLRQSQHSTNNTKPTIKP